VLGPSFLCKSICSFDGFENQSRCFGRRRSAENGKGDELHIVPTPMKAKGYARLVNVYKPLTGKEARWGRVNPKFVGRKKEIGMPFKDRVCMGRVRLQKECFCSPSNL